jgi:hypothetical protein
VIDDTDGCAAILNASAPSFVDSFGRLIFREASFSCFD